MPRLGLLNMIIGFLVIFVSASGGTFLSLELTEMFLNDPEALNTWQDLLRRSAHGHVNLFGMLHVLFGLTVSYSRMPNWVKVAQTAGLFFGVLGMGPAMLIRASQGPTTSYDANGLIIGFLMSCALLAIGSHIVGLMMKYQARQ